MWEQNMHHAPPPPVHHAHPLHFDTFGSLQHVLEAVDRMVPLIFKGEGLAFLPSLKEMIRMQAHNNHWKVIVLSLSKGMARQELDVLLNHPHDHEGPLVIDATASSPAYDVIYNESMLLTRKERFIRINDETDDVMIVLYGLEGLDAPMELKLLMRRMHYMGVTLDTLLERGDSIEAGATEESFKGALQRALSHIRSIYSHDTSEGTSVRVEHISTAAFASLSSLLQAYDMTHAADLRQQLDIIINGFKELPAVYRAIGFSYDPLVKTANELQKNPHAAETLEAKALEADLDDRPEIPNLLEHRPGSADGMQNNPNEVNAVLNNSNTMAALENTYNSSLLVNNPLIRDRVTREHKHHVHEQLSPEPD